MNLRMIGIGAVVVFTALLPLAASAGTAEGPESSPRAGGSEGPGTFGGAGGPDGARAPGGSGAPPSPGAHDGRPAHDDAKPSPRARVKGAPESTAHAPAAAGPAEHEPAARCGPALVSPEGIEAQTCVLSEDRDTWARTYYRNATGGRLRSVLTLMGPRGHTVQTNCSVLAGDQPGVCETPREPARGKPGAYSAVAEFSGTSDEAPLLLRSGSQAPDGGAVNSAVATAR
ncbi:hypothetical protein [Streptomyces sp. cg36]|uniref:hypothetical protein n=1 Tax=Streptomyces sp. cg36 TaxID=3238798 RepID=UPI0034E2B354